MEPGLNIVEIKQTDAEAFLSYFPQGYTGISMEEGFIGFGLYNGEFTAGALLAQNDEAVKNLRASLRMRQSTLSTVLQRRLSVPL